MADDIVHQALFGYARGHRMLAASQPLPTEASRVLRAATDTAVERYDSRYLTVLPLPDLRAQAFIRTWPAEEWLRPGSVWSHVLLVDFVLLANLNSFGGVTSLFRRPQLAPDEPEPDLEPYRQPLAVARDEPAGVLDRSLAAQVLSAVYGTEGRILITVEDAAAAEATLLAVHEQQWPRLRRHFAFRTRLRPSDAPKPYDLDVVERARSTNASPKHAQEWVAPLVDDLAAGSGTDLRRFLRTFGSGSANGRRDMPALVTLYSSLVHDPAPSAVEVLCNAFPSPRQMTGLKRALFGPDDGRQWTPPHWPQADPDRLVLLFAAPPTALDYDDLVVGTRIVAAIEADPAAAADALHRLDLERLPPLQVQAVVTAVVERTTDEVAAAIAAEQPDLGVLLVAHRPLLLARPGVWSMLDPDLLGEVYRRASADQQRATLRALLDDGAHEPLTTLCAASPSMWWDLLFEAARGGTDPAKLVEDGHVLRRVLGRVGAAAIGAPHEPPHTQERLLALLLSADLSTGLWRHAPAEAWVTLWRSVAATPGRLPPPLPDRLSTVALLAATSSGPRPLRVSAWLATFPHLHRALADAAFDDEAWLSLADALPAAPDWDRCLRLRRGAVGEIRRDRWAADDTASILEASGRYRDEMLDELQATPSRKKGKNWLRKLLETVSPWE